MFVIDKLSYSFDTKSIAAVDCVSMILNPGELVCILAPSGHGKTTLLKLISGKLNSNNGKITLNQQPILLGQRKNIAALTSSKLPKEKTCHQVLLEKGLKVMPRSKVIEFIRELQDLFELENLQKRKANELSEGQRKRFCLMYTLISKPKVLCIDELLDSLDQNLLVMILQRLKTFLLEKHMYCFLVTHRGLEIMGLCDKVAIMHFGKLVDFNTPYNIYFHPSHSQSAHFFYPCNILTGTIIGDGLTLKTEIGNLQLKESQLKGRVLISIRPEGIIESPIGQLRGKLIRKWFFAGKLLAVVSIKNKEFEVNLSYDTFHSQVKKIQFDIPARSINILERLS